MRRQPTIKLSFIDFFSTEDLIEFEYYGLDDEVRIIYLCREDFARWVLENDYLTIDDEWFNHWISEFTQRSFKITMDEFLFEDEYDAYRTILAKDYFHYRLREMNFE